MSQSTSETILHETPWTRWVSRPWGKEALPYYCVVLPDYITMVPRLPDGRYLMVKQYRPAVREFTLEFPSGLREKGEEPQISALRELQEETGWKAKNAQHLGSFHTDTGRLDNHIHYYFVDCENPVNNWKPEAGIEVVILSQAEIETAIDQHHIFSMHMTAWFLAQRQLSRLKG
jgi:ADP-ribose pyrophosphatase